MGKKRKEKKIINFLVPVHETVYGIRSPYFIFVFLILGKNVNMLQAQVETDIQVQYKTSPKHKS